MNEEALRPVIIDYGRETEKGFFHGWTEDASTDIEDHAYVYKSAIIEIARTGEIICISPEKIRFTDRP